MTQQEIGDRDGIVHARQRRRQSFYITRDGQRHFQFRARLGLALAEARLHLFRGVIPEHRAIVVLAKINLIDPVIIFADQPLDLAHGHGRVKCLALFLEHPVAQFVHERAVTLNDQALNKRQRLHAKMTRGILIHIVPELIGALAILARGQKPLHKCLHIPAEIQDGLGLCLIGHVPFIEMADGL